MRAAEVLPTPAPLVCGSDCFVRPGLVWQRHFHDCGNEQRLKTYLVISGNADDVAQLKEDYASHASMGQILDGDQHSGDLICEHDSAKNGHHLHFALYGRTISSAQCQLVFGEFP